MKKTLLSAITLLCAVHTSFAADIYVNNSGQPGTWSTITLALAASAPNDRIFVSPYGAYTENLTISKNLTIASAVSGTTVNVVGNVTIVGIANMQLQIIGFEFSSTITAQTGSASLSGYSDIYIVGCKASGISGQAFNRMHILYCQMPSTSITFLDGDVRGSTFLDLTVNDGPNAGIGDTTFIIGNSFRRLIWGNDDNYMFVANNYIFYNANSYAMYFTKTHFNSLVTNTIRNNTIRSIGTTNANTAVRFINTAGLNWGNVVFYNNILSNSFAACGCGVVIGSCLVTVAANKPVFYYNNLENFTDFFGQNIAGNVTGATGTVDALGRATGTNQIDQGSPSLEYYDIDLTRNDMGTFGGPYSIDNYMNTADGKARVYDLNMPFEIWSGSTPQVKAEATHIK